MTVLQDVQEAVTVLEAALDGIKKVVPATSSAGIAVNIASMLLPVASNAVIAAVQAAEAHAAAANSPAVAGAVPPAKA